VGPIGDQHPIFFVFQYAGDDMDSCSAII